MSKAQSNTEAAFAVIHDARLAVERRRSALKRAQEDLDRLAAQAVSTNAQSATWYRHPGDLTAEQVQGAAGWTDAQLHNAVKRYQQRVGAARRTVEG